uniref:Uncharacterized protein n=1 Tax=Lepeophtheirus salmonis TaxID=72036 RepID=A0A0K2VKT2_LEPSM
MKEECYTLLHTSLHQVCWYFIDMMHNNTGISLVLRLG